MPELENDFGVKPAADGQMNFVLGEMVGRDGAPLPPEISAKEIALMREVAARVRQMAGGFPLEQAA